MIFFKRYYWLFFVILFAVFSFIGATKHPLWGDEAEVALFARSILKHGIPYGWDGINLMGYHNGLYLNGDLVNRSNPWMQYYVTAASFFLFGESAFAARFTFVLLSVASLIVVYQLALEITKNKRAALITLITLSISVPYILFSYQAHHYALTIFFGLLFFYFSLVLHDGERQSALPFIFSGIGFAYSHYVSFFVFFATLGILFSVNYLVSRKWRALKSWIMSYAGYGILIWLTLLPWFFILRPLEGRGEISFGNMWSVLKQVPAYWLEGVRYFNHNNAFPVLFIPLAIIIMVITWRKRQSARPILLCSGFAVLYLFFASVLSAIAPLAEPPLAIRHTIVLFPILAIGTGWMLESLLRVQEFVFCIVLGLFVFTNVFTLQPVRIWLLEYAHELFKSYPSASLEVARYLNRFSEEGQTVFVNLERDQEPLQFYMTKKLKLVNRVRSNNPTLFPRNYSVLPTYIYQFRGEPDWVILFSKRPNNGSYFTFDMRPLPPGIDLAKNYEEIVLPVFFSDMSRPEIELHSFREITPDYRDQVFIYKKK